MMSGHAANWTLDELCGRVGSALADDYGGVPSGRVRDVPDRRAVRYYTTLGLIDRPAAMLGRTALYGPRHLLQLVAIKRLQAQGLSLRDVQERLLGASDADLAAVARLPTEPPGPTTPEPREFWKEAPAMAGPAAPAESEPTSAVRAVPLGGEALLVLAATRELAPDDRDAIRAAAQPLLQLLASRRLVRPG
jgi:DNA-binding transcriptional MerR regulator